MLQITNHPLLESCKYTSREFTELFTYKNYYSINRFAQIYYSWQSSANPRNLKEEKIINNLSTFIRGDSWLMGFFTTNKPDLLLGCPKLQFGRSDQSQNSVHKTINSLLCCLLESPKQINKVLFMVAANHQLEKKLTGL